MSERIEGRRPVLSALKADRVSRMMIAAGAHHAIVEEIRTEALARGVEIEEVPRSRLDSLSATGKHQGVIADARARLQRGWESAVDQAEQEGRVPFLVALDGIQDPHNLGALVRSAAAFGADAVLIPEDRAAGMTETAVKAAAGAAEVVEVDTVRSLQAAIERAKERKCWVVALAEEGDDTVANCALLTESVMLIIGSEGRGVSRTLRQAADILVRLDTTDQFPTLNASVAGAIAMYEVRAARRRHG